MTFIKSLKTFLPCHSVQVKHPGMIPGYIEGSEMNPKGSHDTDPEIGALENPELWMIIQQVKATYVNITLSDRHADQDTAL